MTEQRRADMMAAAPWIREALKTTNDKAKLFEAQVAELTEKCDGLTKANAALKAKLVRQCSMRGTGFAQSFFFFWRYRSRPSKRASQR